MVRARFAALFVLFLVGVAAWSLLYFRDTSRDSLAVAWTALSATILIQLVLACLKPQSGLSRLKRHGLIS